MKGEEASRDPAAALALCDAMSEISERCWCAGWMLNVEFFLWAMLEGAPRDYGLVVVPEEALENLRRLSERAGGWCRWNDEHRDESFVAIDAWRVAFEASLPRMLDEVDRTGVASDPEGEAAVRRWRSFFDERANRSK